MIRLLLTALKTLNHQLLIGGVRGYIVRRQRATLPNAGVQCHARLGQLVHPQLSDQQLDEALACFHIADIRFEVLVRRLRHVARHEVVEALLVFLWVHCRDAMPILFVVKHFHFVFKLLRDAPFLQVVDNSHMINLIIMAGFALTNHGYLGLRDR